MKSRLLGPIRAPAVMHLLHRGAWGLADQALLSLASFVTLALIARASSLNDFGVFSLAFTLINVEMTLAASLLSEPFAVISTGYAKGRYAAYVTSTYVMHLCLGILVSGVLIIGALVDAALGWSQAQIILLIIPAMLAWQLQDFTRQPLYVEGRVAAAFLNDVISYGGQILGIALASYLDVLTSESALGIVAATSGIAALVGLYQMRGSLTLSLSVNELRGHMRATWQFGRWVIGGTFLESISYYLQPFFLAAFRGASAAGELRALMTLMGPARIILRGIVTAFIPLAGATFEKEGKQGLSGLVKKTALLGLPLMGAYCLFVSIQPTALVTFVLGEEYARSASWLLPLIALSFLVQMLFTPFEIGLRALRVTGPIFLVGALSFIAFWCVGVPAIYFFGLTGAAMVTLMIPSIAVVVLARTYLQEMAPAAD